MRFYHFTEMPYPHVPEEAEVAHRGLKGFIPNRYFDPVRGHELYRRYLDEYELADALGFDLMVNEHHQSAMTLQSAATVTAALVASRTQHGRILLLGTPLPHRPSPVRVAEEIAVLDTVTGGRIECGFVRGTQVEAYPSNENPARNLALFMEAHDLIREAWTRGDPFSWEGRFYHYRYVSIWPRCYQQPHPPIWISATSPDLVRWTAAQGHRLSVLLGTYAEAASVYALYRRELARRGEAEPGPERFAYLAFCHVAESDAQARAQGRELMWYLKPGRPRLGAAIPPGFAAPERAVAAFNGRLGATRRRCYEELIEEGIMLVGSPDTVARQIRRLYRTTGVGNLLLMNHAGAMPSNQVRDSLALFAHEVMPQVRSLGDDWRDDDARWRVADGSDAERPVVASALS